MLFHVLRTVSLLILLTRKIGAAGSEIYVSQSGNNSSLCTKEIPCKTIDKALSLASRFNSAKIILAKGNYTMKNSYKFIRMTSFALLGNGSNREDIKITCDVNVSLSFILSENIYFEGVKIRKCGEWHQSTYRAENYPNFNATKFKAALDFRYCRNLRISNVEISSSPGLGANLYDVGGLVNITESMFADNKASNDSSSDKEGGRKRSPEYVHSGGGVSLVLNRYSSKAVKTTPGEHDVFQHDNHYLFKNCHFLRNEAHWSSNSENEHLNTPERPFSSGGGLAVLFEGNASRCSVAIQACQFTGNQALWGGGLQIKTKDTAENNTFLIEGTTFRKNKANFAGGGARVGNIPYKYAQLSLNFFHFKNCSFVNNVAVWGAGASVLGTTIARKCTKHTDPAVTQFYFNRCTWQNNEGNIGAAIGLYLYNYNQYQIGPGIPYRVCFDKDNLFESNKFHNKVNQINRYLTIGQGALYSMQVPLIFKNTATFSNNSKSALVLDGTTLEVFDRLTFYKNTGFRGGAIAMYGLSRIIFHENANLTFEENSCDDKGGAMYIQAPGPPLESYNTTDTSMPYTCFFGYFNSSVEFNKWNATVIFKDNSVPYKALGTSVYATTIERCFRAGENRHNNSVLRWKFVKFKNLNENFTNFSGEVATDPVDIEYLRRDWEVAPGEVFNATVKLLDEVKNIVPGIIDIVIKPPSVGLNNPSSLFLTTGKITNINLRGREGSNFSVQINCIGSKLLGNMMQDVKLKKCYAGFRFSIETSMCECMNSVTEERAKGISRCLSGGRSVFVKQGFWAGEVADNFFTHICPYGYCNSSVFISNEYRYVKDHMCNQGRNQSSILCGQCDENHTITVGSEKCATGCTNWYLLLLIPIGVGLLLLVMGIMLIDLDVFTSYFNSWLYSYHVMKLLVPDGFQFNPFSEFVVALTNMQLQIGGFSFCLVKNWDDADKLMVMYAMPVFVITTVVLLAKMVGAFPSWCFSRRVKAPFRGICTILVLCYTDVTYITLRILRYAKVGSKTVLFVNGDIEYFSGKHLYYGIVAIFFMVVFVLSFPIFLLFRPFLTNGLRPVLNLNRWNPFFDALQSCFKDQYRWCAAFYFICRLVILVIYTFVPTGPVKRILLEGCCIMILLTFSIVRPYKEACDVKEDEESYDWMYKSDVVLLTTLTFLAVVSSPIDNSSATSDIVKRGLETLLDILSWVPVAVLLVVACCAVRKYLHTCKGPLHDETVPLMSEKASSRAKLSKAPGIFKTRHSSIGNRRLRGRLQTRRSLYGSIDI